MIDAILSKLNDSGIQARPSSAADANSYDSAPSLVALVDPVINKNIWPVKLPSDAPPENAVYALAGQGDIEIDGYRLGRIDTYVLSFRSPDFDPLREKSLTLRDRVAQHAGQNSWEITDAATDFEYDQTQYRTHFELQCGVATSSDEGGPIAYVHSVQATAQPPNVISSIDQVVTEFVAVVIIAESASIQSTRDALFNVLLGLGANDDSIISTLRYQSGSRVATSGRHVFWRELYEYQRIIDKQATP